MQGKDKLMKLTFDEIEVELKPDGKDLLLKTIKPISQGNLVIMLRLSKAEAYTLSQAINNTVAYIGR